ncbi:MAG: alpha/beta fold hydrolase, partial [Acidimicrobiales bacterium]
MPGDLDAVLHLVERGSGPTLVLVHGVAGSHAIFDPLVPLLADDFRVVAVDLLGYGSSPKPAGIDYTPGLHVRAIRQTLARRSIPPPYCIVGLSMGVDLALEYARTWPAEVASLVGLGFPYYPDEAAARRGLRNNLWTMLALERPALARLAIPTAWWLGRHLPALARRLSTIYTPAMARDALRASYHAFRSSLWWCMVRNRLGP